jgi:hypothetical protein
MRRMSERHGPALGRPVAYGNLDRRGVARGKFVRGVAARAGARRRRLVMADLTAPERRERQARVFA